MAAVKGMFRRGEIWWLRYSVNGKQQRISLETNVETMAVLKAVGILQRAPLEASQGGLQGELDAYLRESLALRRLSKTCADNRRYFFSAFQAATGIDRVAELSKSRVESWVENLKAAGGRTEETVRSYVFHLRAFCSWLVKKNRMRENVVAHLEMGKIERNVRKNFVSKADVVRLIAEAPTDSLRLILYCGFHAGLRKMEIVELRPDWIDVGSAARRGRITIQRTETFSCKDKEGRTVPLTAEFSEWLRGYMLTLPAGAEYVLVPDNPRGKLYRYDFRKPFAEYMRAQRVKCTPHDMRRTFVSLRLIEDSSLIFKLAKWTGDGVEVLQRHYGHLLADDDDIELD